MLRLANEYPKFFVFLRHNGQRVCESITLAETYSQEASSTMSTAAESSVATGAPPDDVDSVEVESAPKPDDAANAGVGNMIGVKHDQEKNSSTRVGGVDNDNDAHESSPSKSEKSNEQTIALRNVLQEQQQQQKYQHANNPNFNASQPRDQEGQEQGQQISDARSVQKVEKSLSEQRKESQDEKKEEIHDETPIRKTRQEQPQPQQQSRKQDRELGQQQQPQQQTAPPTPNRGRQPRRSPQQPVQQIQPQSLSYKSNSSTTDIVHSMFGPSVGLCMGDFTCQYNRITGRLYACTEAILFYSNLFGFEKKFYFRYEDVLQMQLYRSTSIQVTVQELQATSHYDYIFKGFSDRVQTLRLLISLWQQDQGAENIEAADEEDVNDTSASNDANSNFNDSNNILPDPSLIGLGEARPISPPTTNGDDDNTILSPDAPSQSTLPNLPPSILRQSKISTSQHSNPPSPARMNPGNNSTSRRLFDITPSGERSKSLPAVHRRRNRQRAHSDGAEPSLRSNTGVTNSDYMNLNHAPNDGDRAAWETAKNSADPCIQYIGIEPLTLPCSLGSFFELFLANDAPHSFEVYQKGEAVRDLDIQISPWREDSSEKGALLRVLEFRHPVSKSLGIGPSHAPTKKQQKLQRFPGCGLCLTNTTSVEGVPASDCFDVMDYWLVEVVNGDGPPGVMLSAKFGASFKKRTFLKSIILKNVKSGTQEWFQGYAAMVQTVMKGQPSDTTLVQASSPTTLDTDDANANKKVEESVSSASKLLFILAVTAQILLVICLLLVLRELRVSQHTSEILLDELKHMRMEHGQVLNALLAQQNMGHRD